MRDHIDLDLALRLHFPIVVIESHDEVRVKRLLSKAVVTDLSLGNLLSWSAADGLEYAGKFAAQHLSVEGIDTPEKSAAGDTTDPEQLLRHIKEHVKKSVILLPDFHPYLTNPIIVRLLKEIAQNHYINENTLVLVSHSIQVPDELERLCTHVALSLPDIEAIRRLIHDEAKVWQRKQKKPVKADPEAIELLAQNLLGLTHGDVTRLIRNAIYDDGAITQSDVRATMEAKYKLLAEDGALSFSLDTAKFADVGGFARLKEWLATRKPFFLEATPESLDVPKGILLLGVQGCGKSLAAKAVAGAWGVPLLRLDIAGLYNKYIGETEKNIRDALALCEVLAPCVLWVDEIEKAIQSGNDDTGTSNRMLGTLLTWMAEKSSAVFIVATSNDISRLPPELVRKGRLDEIFFVDLPSLESRIEILKLHLQKRDLKPEDFALAVIAEQSEGFSGAELEQLVVSALYQARSENQPVSTELLLKAATDTRPLSVVREEDILALRHWAETRTVKVDA